MNGKQRPGWYFAHALNDVNPYIMRMLEDSFSLDAVHMVSTNGHRLPCIQPYLKIKVQYDNVCCSLGYVQYTLQMAFRYCCCVDLYDYQAPKTHGGSGECVTCMLMFGVVFMNHPCTLGAAVSVNKWKGVFEHTELWSWGILYTQTRRVEYQLGVLMTRLQVERTYH